MHNILLRLNEASTIIFDLVTCCVARRLHIAVGGSDAPTPEPIWTKKNDRCGCGFVGNCCRVRVAESAQSVCQVATDTELEDKAS